MTPLEILERIPMTNLPAVAALAGVSLEQLLLAVGTEQIKAEHPAASYRHFACALLHELANDDGVWTPRALQAAADQIDRSDGRLAVFERALAKMPAPAPVSKPTADTKVSIAFGRMHSILFGLPETDEPFPADADAAVDAAVQRLRWIIEAFTKSATAHAVLVEQLAQQDVVGAGQLPQRQAQEGEADRG